MRKVPIMSGHSTYYGLRLWCCGLRVKLVGSKDCEKARNIIRSKIFDFKIVLIRTATYCETRDSYFSVI